MAGPTREPPGRPPLRRFLEEAPWPREHGAWAMLLLPVALGFAAAGRAAGAAVWIAAALLLFFLSRAALVPGLARQRQGRPLPRAVLARRMAWGAVEFAAALACIAAALARSGPAQRSDIAVALIAPVLLGSIHAALGLLGSDRNLAGEVLGMTGLASAAPLVAAAAGTPPGARTSSAAALALAYFLSSLAFVRAYRKKKSEGRVDVRGCVWAHAGIAASLVALWAADALPAPALAAFVPVLARTVWGLAHPPRDLGALGRREIAVAVTFTLAAAGAYLV